MSSNPELSSRGALANAPVRSRTASPVTTTGRSSDTVPIVGRFALLQRFNLSQGYAELAEELTDKIAPIMRRQPGFLSLTLLSDETSGEYIFLTHWHDLDQLNTFERSADEWRIRDIMSEHLTAVPQIEVYQLHNLAAEVAEETTASE
jgi:heme-degrading monooxygenase HmoA